MEKDRQLLVTSIKEWVKVEEEIAQMRRELKLKTTKKKELTADLLRIMKDRKLDAIDLQDNRLVRQTRSTKTAITKKSLNECLSRFYKSEDKGKEMAAYILDARTSKTNEILYMK
jgi:hypothetical protein